MIYPKKSPTDICLGEGKNSKIDQATRRHVDRSMTILSIPKRVALAVAPPPSDFLIRSWQEQGS